MKKIFILLFVITGAGNYSGQTTYTWTAATSTLANVATNWNPSTGIPGSNDNVVFNGTSSSNCGWNITTITSMSLLSGYGGMVDMGTTNKNIKQNLVINAGTLLATTGTLARTIQGVSAIFQLGAGGVFTHNGGVFSLPVDGGDNYTFSGNIVLNTLVLKDASTNAERSIDFGSNLTVNTLSYSGVAPDPISFQGSIHIQTSLNLSSATYATALTGANTANFIFDGASASITGQASAGEGWLPNVQINTTGAYTMANNLSITGNWTGTQGALTVGSSTENFYGSSATITGTAAAFDNLTVQTGGSVAFPANTEVTVGGALTQSGTGVFTFQSTSILGLNGSGAQSLSGGPYTLAGIHIHSGSRTVTLSTPLTIADSVKVDANATFATGSNLTLKSTSSLTARLAQLGSGASVTGNVTVETLIPGGTTGWANLGVRGVNGQTFASWDTYVSSGGANGIPMTCTGCAYSQSVLPSWFNSIEGWDEPNDTYDSLTVTSALSPGTGFWVYVGNGQSTTTDLKVINTGALTQGSMSITVTNAGTVPADQGFNLVANPYASPISVTKLFANANNAFDFDQTVYVWNADLSGGAGAYTYYNTGSGTSPGGTGSINDVIPGGQGFYVFYQNNFGFPLSFDETMKVDNSGGSNPLLRSASTNTNSTFRLKLAGSNDWDGTLFAINSRATISYDRKYDARKIFQSPGYVGYPGPYTKYTTISSKDGFGNDYAINALPLLTQSLSIPILAKVSGTGTYTISAYDFQNFNPNVCLSLRDKLNNTYHDLRQSDYSFTIQDTTSSPRFELILCRDESVNPTGIKEVNESNSILINQDLQGAYVKTAFAQNTKATISVYNIIGQKLMDDIHVEGTVTNTQLNIGLHNQVVLIRVVTDKESSTKKIVLQ
jgi:hypothetical protein